MKFLAIVLAAAMLPFAGFADGNTQLLWPTSGMPDAQAGVAAPYLEWSDAPASNVGSCVIIVASGDYASTGSVAGLRSLEEKLIANGVTCVWLHSRPSAAGLPVYKAALEDGQRAVRLVRQAATTRGYSADKIGVMGFADGAHLSLLLATSSQTAAYTKVDSVDDIACNVNFAIPMSPTRVLASGTTIDTAFSFDNKTCTMCLFHGQDDAVTSPIATTRIYRKLRTMTVSNGAKVPSEIHLIPGRGHDLVTASEFDRAVEFLCQSGFLGTLGAEVQLNSRFPNDNDRATYTKVSLWPEGKTPDYQSAQNEPYLEWHMPKELNTRAVQILYAGGAYGFNNPQDFEVTPLRRYLNAKGMAVVTIKYRCPRPEGLPKHMSAWQDLQRTIRLVRDEAPRRGLDPNSIGIMGCSAGGHLTLMGATTSQTAAYARIDAVDDLPCNVKWAIAIYPAYALTDGADGENTNGGNLDTDVLVNDFAFDASTCNMLFMHGDADSYAAMNSVKCWEKLRTMNIESELHTLATRRHTFQQNASPGTASYNINDIIWEYVDDFAAAAVAPEAVDGQPSGDQSGITDAKMIQDLIDAAAAKTPAGAVALSAGTFYVNAQLNVTNGVTLAGQGWTNTVIKRVVNESSWTAQRCAMLDGGAKIEGVALTGGAIKAQSENGAGVLVKDGTVSWCCITNNVSKNHANSGYGVSFSGGQGSIDHSIVANNVSGSGLQGGFGAGIAVNDTTGAVTIDACLVANNAITTGGGSGGGLCVKNLAADCTVRNCTIVGNAAVSNAGGLDLASATGPGKLVLVNTILAGNRLGDSESNLRSNNSFFDAVNSRNCFVGLASETAVNIGGVNYDLTGFKSGDPKFVDPSNGDYRLQEDSPANGEGATYDGIGNDLDGKAFAAPPSIGCYEYGVGEPPAPHTHDWGAPSYGWASDNSTCTATAVCTENSAHVTNETVTASYQVVQAATTEAAGTGRYTATFSSALFSTQIKDVVIPQLNPGPGPEPADAIQPGASASANRLTIQDAIDAAAPTHGTVTLGSGLFEIDAQLNVTGGVTLVGQGWENTVIKQTIHVTYGANSRCAMLDDGAKLEGLTLTGGSIMNTGDGGAGAWVKNGTISWCCITNNIGGQHYTYGCGISFSSGQGTVDHCIISDNNATGGASFYGGGIGGLDTVGPVTIDTCLIVNNLLDASGAGGGIGIKNIGGDCVVRNCTVVGNTANTHSAGIRIENRAAGNSTAVGIVINTIAAGNMKSGAEVNYADNYVVDKTNSSNCFFGLADEAALFADSLSGDPKFVVAANGDYRLSGESLAKNAGVVYSGIGVDLDGAAFAAAPSIGCYEFNPNAQPRPDDEWDIPGTSGGIKALDDGHGVKYIVFASIARDGAVLTVGFAADKVDANGQVFGLLCKTDLADTATFTVNATLANGVSDTLGTLNAILPQPYPQLFVVGIGPAKE